MSDTAQRNVTRLLIEFLKDIAHDIRSPLSVIASDLHYLNSQSSKEPVDSWKRSLAIITGILDDATSFPAPGQAYGSWQQVKERSANPQLLAADDTLPSDLLLQGCPALTAAILASLLLTQQPETPLTFELNSQWVTIHLKTTQTASQNQQDQLTAGQYSLNTERSPSTLKLAELLLTLNGGSITNSGNHLQLSLPRYEGTRDSHS